MDVNANARPSPEEPALGGPQRTRELQGFVRAGLAYLDRYGGPRARVRRALDRRAKRRGLEAEAAAALVDAAMAELDRLDVIDDRAFAAGRAAALRRRGASRRAALAKLAEAGVAPDLAAAALAAEDAADGEPADDAAETAERAAARRYAERRRLGPWRLDPGKRAERRDRDVAALARAGFPVPLSIAVIDGEAA